MDNSLLLAKALAIGAFSFAVLSQLGILVRRYVLIPKLTILDEIPQLGKPRKDRTKISGRAVVCGGSISGLLAAAVCADHFEYVTIVEPDASANDERGVTLPKDTKTREGVYGAPVPINPRPRVGQWFNPHAYQVPMYASLVELFPGSPQELQRLNVKPVVPNIRLNNIAEPYGERHESDAIPPGAPVSLSISRETYETLLRSLVKKSRPNVEFMAGTAHGVRRSNDNVDVLDRVLIRTEAGDVLKAATLVIDATGPSQAGHKWLRAAGFDAIPKDEYDPKQETTCTTFTIPPHLQAKVPLPWGFKPGIIAFQPPNPTLKEPRAFLATLVDRNQLQIGTYGQNFQDRPRTMAELCALIPDLAGSKQKEPHTPPWFYDLFDFLLEHEAECDPFHVDYPTGIMSQIKYSEAKLGALPRNFVAVGDARMKLNPAGGQGCIKATYDAVALDVLFRGIPSTRGAELPACFARDFFEKQAGRTQAMWQNAKDADYAFPGTVPVKGETLDEGKMRRAFGEQLMSLCRKDPEAYTQLRSVIVMTSPPTDLFAPWLLVRVARHWFFG